VPHSNSQSQKNQEQIKLLSEKINGLVQEAEQMGTQGHVEEAQGLMKLCDKLKEERDALRKQNESIHWSQVELFLIDNDIKIIYQNCVMCPSCILL